MDLTTQPEKKIARPVESGQAVVEALLVLPFLMALIVWLFQYFSVIQSSVIHQTEARQHLWSIIDHQRNLREGENCDFGTDSGCDPKKRSLSVTIGGIRKEAGSFGLSNHREILLNTTVGICRDAICK